MTMNWAAAMSPSASQRRLFEAPGQHSMYARVLLEACRVGNRPEVGIEATSAMLTWTRLWDSESLRLRAEFAAELHAPPHQVLADLTRALDIATRQGALMPRLRAAAALLCFQQRSGNAVAIDAARRELASTLNELTEGRDLDEVKAATALLGA